VQVPRRIVFASPRSGVSLLSDMKRTATRRAQGVRPIRFRAQPLLSLALAVLFAFQGFLVNTHVHLLPLAGAPIAYSDAAHTVLADDKAPVPDTDGVCSLCMAAALVGTYSLPPAIIVYRPADFRPLERANSVHYIAFLAPRSAWQSRAPPIA
jgi:hypothetical protein